MTANASGTAVSPDYKQVRAAALAKAGFVHVTGLPTVNVSRWATWHTQLGENAILRRYHTVVPDDPPAPEGRIIQAHVSELGHSDYNNGKAAVVTTDGEVWLGTGGALELGLHRPYVTGSGAWVPCSNGEEVPTHFLLERARDPYSDCNGRHSPVPQVQGLTS